MAIPTNELHSDGPTAHNVASRRIVSIEHPSIIKNFDRGFKSLGGEAQIKHVLEHHVGDSKLSSKQNGLPEPVVGVSLRPNDPLAKKIPSTGVETRNVLVKVTVPKRTGRKRKRGSDGPFEYSNQEPQNNNVTAPDLLQRLRDSNGDYSIEALGVLRETHRFRTLADFQLRNAEVPIMQELRDHVMTTDYEKLKDFTIDLEKAGPATTAFPGPPQFVSSDLPFKYEYEQATGVVFLRDQSGNLTSKNMSAAPRRVTWGLPPDAVDIPQSAPLELPKRNPHGDMLPRAIEELQKLLEVRPLVTKRVALNAMPPVSESIFKEATQFVGYSFKAGPWRDSLIRYGIDPRKDPKYRFYQTMTFQSDREAFKMAPESAKVGDGNHNTLWARTLRHKRADPTTHIFDGKNITANGKTWQICDITDPILHDIFQTDNIRSECDVYQWGWYHNGTVAKGRAIMKDKMRYLFAGTVPPHEDYVPVAAMPEIVTSNSCHLSKEKYGLHISQMSLDMRNIAKNLEHQRVGASKRWGAKQKGVGTTGDEAQESAGEGAEDAEPREEGKDEDGNDDGDGQGDFDEVDEEQAGGDGNNYQVDRRGDDLENNQVDGNADDLENDQANGTGASLEDYQADGNGANLVTNQADEYGDGE